MSTMPTSTKTIKNNSVISVSEFYPKFKKLAIESDFDFDDDCASHFEVCRFLEEFEVLGKESPFFTIDGVLYYDKKKFLTPKGTAEKNIIWSCCHGLRDEGVDYSGVFLVAVPPAFRQKNLTIPDGVIGICCSAFANTAIENLFIPNSVRIIGMGTFRNMESLTNLYVPKHLMDRVEVDHNNVFHNVNIMYNDYTSISSDDAEDWKCILQGVCPPHYPKKEYTFEDDPF